MKMSWSRRLQAERLAWRSSVFVTLTYDEKNVPWTSADGTGVHTLKLSDTQLFMKRLRKAANKAFDWKQRFYLVGEYGDDTWRPHYHAALFDFPPCGRGDTLTSPTGLPLWEQCCPTCYLVGRKWQKGHVKIGRLDADRCKYLASYVTKKLTNPKDDRLDGRAPEFNTQSRGGRVKGARGIAGAIVPEMAHKFLVYKDRESDDVINELTGIGNLGKYMKKKLREEIDTPREVRDAASHKAWSEQVLPLLPLEKEAIQAFSLRQAVRTASLPHAEKLRFHAERYRRQKKGRAL